jgi:hypothetical protein
MKTTAKTTTPPWAVNQRGVNHRFTPLTQCRQRYLFILETGLGRIENGGSTAPECDHPRADNRGQLFLDLPAVK